MSAVSRSFTHSSMQEANRYAGALLLTVAISGLSRSNVQTKLQGEKKNRFAKSRYAAV